MAKLITQATTLADWYTLVNEAEVSCSKQLAEDIENYLIFLLIRFTDQPGMMKSVLALEFLEALQTLNYLHSERLKEVGDKCLLVSGLFPARSQQLRLNSDYFIDMGKSAYSVLSEEEGSELFAHLCEEFVPIKTVLHAMRDLNKVIPLLGPDGAIKSIKQNRRLH